MRRPRVPLVQIGLLFLLALLFLLSSTLVFLPAPVIAATGCGDTITVSTTLSADIGPCSGYGLTIGANNITLNCAGHTITGTGSFAGVDINGFTGVTVKNCDVTEFVGDFFLQSSSGNTLTGNTAESYNYWGFYLQGSSGNTLNKNTASDNVFGFYLTSSPGNILNGNTADANRQYGYFDDSTGSGAAGTANTYRNDEGSGNALMCSSPSGLCGAAAPLVPEFPFGMALLLAIGVPAMLLISRRFRIGWKGNMPISVKMRTCTPYED